jgi:hypothetical protein
MRSLTTAVAAIALMAGVAHAQGQGQGGGNDRGGGKPAEAGQQGGGGQGKADRGNRSQGGGSDARQGGGPAMAQARGPEQRGSDNRGGGNGNAQREERGNTSADRGNSGADRGNRGNERASSDNGGRGNSDRAVVIDRRNGNRGRDIDLVRVGGFDSIAPRGLISGCPPGLARKRNGCQPPGQDRKDDWLGWDRPDFWGLSGLGGGRYFYDDGYLMRFGPDGRIGGYVPLLGGALSVGNAWPSYYEPFEMPGYYEQYYGLGGYDSYRYADDVIYRVDPETSAITSIVALLTGDQFAVGQPMPRGYDVYNVPYDYRDQYLDGPDANYRYADGYVYQVDPKTQLIASAIELLVS